mmetsp:Transcript_82207/g.232793  ORF Transcript_82207/g.232793 Transcript_82207/m.232793 type:complete len:288 (+) Transcript_82207:1834-2697(+)
MSGSCPAQMEVCRIQDGSKNTTIHSRYGHLQDMCVQVCLQVDHRGVAGDVTPLTPKSCWLVQLGIGPNDGLLQPPRPQHQPKLLLLWEGDQAPLHRRVGREHVAHKQRAGRRLAAAELQEPSPTELVALVPGTTHESLPHGGGELSVEHLRQRLGTVPSILDVLHLAQQVIKDVGHGQQARAATLSGSIGGQFLGPCLAWLCGKVLRLDFLPLGGHILWLHPDKEAPALGVKAHNSPHGSVERLAGRALQTQEPHHLPWPHQIACLLEGANCASKGQEGAGKGCTLA